jgi:hypothetical protein
MSFFSDDILHFDQFIGLFGRLYYRPNIPQAYATEANRIGSRAKP